MKRLVTALATCAPNRRQAILTASAASLVGWPLAAQEDPAETEAAEAPSFGFESVVAKARARASEAHEPRRQDLPAALADLNYDAYRDIRFLPDRRLWADAERGFTVDLLPPGSIYRDATRIHVVEDGVAQRAPFDLSALDFGPLADRPSDEASNDLAWTGFRLRYPLNRPEVDDEVAVFQGASYLRAIGRDQTFGLSARGLALATGSPEGEEFPVFTDFWIVRPEPNAAAITVYALLDSPSVAGAYEFVVRPGAETTMDVRCFLLPRRELAEVGVAPLTSMYYFGPRNSRRVDDYREAAHDSSGLQMLTGRGERLWRPLTNPVSLEISYFSDENPQGFGLAQRERRFEAFQDAEARYERRPSAWVQPHGDWGEGSVTLVEIPTQTEFNDNIVAFWRPRQPLPGGVEREFGYRLYWSAQPPDESPLARVSATREGRAVNDAGLRSIVVDFDLKEKPFEGLTARAETSRGEVRGVTLTRLPIERGARAALDFTPPPDEAAELRLVLLDPEGAPASETWLFRWSPA